MEYEIEAEEFGTASMAPYDLFQAGTALSLMYRLGGTDTEPVSAGSVSASLQVDGPLQFVLLPAREMGELVFFFEYDYPDGTWIVHMAEEDGLPE